MGEQPENKNWAEEIEVAVNEVLDRVKEAVEEGNVRRIILRKEDGSVLVDVSLATGAALSLILVYFAPAIAALATLGGLIAKLKLEIIRTDKTLPTTNTNGKSKVKINVEEE